jgi:hypothetical protein
VRRWRCIPRRQRRLRRRCAGHVQHARALPRLVLQRRGRRTGRACRRCGGGALVRGGHRGCCWCLQRGRRRGRFCRLQSARERLEAGVVIGRGHGDGCASDGSSARGMLGAVRGVGMRDVLFGGECSAWTPARPGSQRRLGAQYAARSRWTTPQRRGFAVDAGELWRAAAGCIG